MTACRFFCTWRDNPREVGCEPAIPALPLPGAEGLKVEESCRESRDFEGSADCEKGVVGEVMDAAALAAPLVVGGKAVVSWGGCWFTVLAGVGGLCIADSEM